MWDPSQFLRFLVFFFCFPVKVTYPRLSAATDIKVWHGKSGKELGTVDTNQLKNNMADISPNGRFIAAAAFTADVKVSSVSILLILPLSFWNEPFQGRRP